ncbi:hypothetical protein M8J76_008676 [Diaphorina citri]|nr:hypothetical protein M8J76_008676 [Diaphorina citri]
MDVDNATDDVTGNSEATDYQEDHMIAEHCDEDHDENKEGNEIKTDEKKENIEVKVENVVVKVEKHVILDSEMLYDYFDESAPKKQEFCCNFPGCNRIFKRHDGIKKHLLTHGNANKVEVTTLNSDSFNDGEGNALSSGDTFTEDKVTTHFKNTAEEPVTLNTGDTSMEVTGTNKREFPCIFPKCGKTFGRPDRLKKHMLIHDNIRQYMQFMLLFSRQGKLRLQKWYVAHPDKLKKKITRELITTILARKPKMCSFLEWKDVKIVYKRYASLYFCCAIEQNDNELLTLEIIHRYVELLDKYFGSVCELDIIFNFEKAYFILDELLLGGEIQETSKKNVLKAIAAQDLLQEEETPQGIFEDHGLG